MAGIGYYRPDPRKQRTQSAKQQSARTPIGCVSRFDTVATSRPSVSTKMWRLRPFTRLCASKPRAPPRSVVLTDGHPGSLPMDKLPVRHGDGPARRARDVDGPTHRSFARLESDGRPCRTVDIRMATVATGSLSAGGKIWR